MSNNFLASYFTNSDADLAGPNGTADLAGRSFFDLISECKDFSKCVENIHIVHIMIN
jgi:hypothetical protein